MTARQIAEKKVCAQDHIGSRCAAILGVSHVAVMKALQSGRIRSDDDGKIDPEAAGADWTRNTRVNVPAVMSADDTLTYRKARRLRLLYEAKLAKLEIDVREGHLVDRAEINRITFERARRARDRLLMVPRRLAAQIAAESDGGEIQAMMRDALVDALEDIASETVKPLWEVKAWPTLRTPRNFAASRKTTRLGWPESILRAENALWPTPMQSTGSTLCAAASWQWPF